MSELSYAEKRKLLAELLEKKNRTRKTAPLSFAQERLFFLDQLQPNSALYNLPVSFRLQTRLDIEALEESLSEIVRRHEVLRTTFEQVEGSPVQVVHPAAPLKLQIDDLSASPDRENEALRLAAIEAQEPFNLRDGPLFRARLLRLHEQDNVLLLTMHHIVSDGWSMLVLIRELSALYESHSRGTVASLPELPIQYSDFARWQRQALNTEVIEKHLDYWRKQLSDAPPILDLPFDRPRPPVQSFRGDMQHFTFSRGLANQLLRLGEQEGATFFMTLLAAFQVLLARYSGQWDVVVGTPIANRNRTELEPLIGFFVNTLALRTTMEDDPIFLDLLRRVKQTTVEAYAHQDLPFEKLVEQLQPDRELSHNPLIQVMFATDLRTDAMRPSSRAAGPPSLLMQTNTGTSKFDLALNMSESQNGLVGILEYNTDLFDATTIQRLIGIWQALLQSIASNPRERVSKLNILTPEERRQLTTLWKGATVPSEPGNGPFYILDTHLNPVPIGVIGELHVGGNKLASDSMYRTGDLARYKSNGVLELLGSIDRHVRIRGMRVDLQRIETVLREFPGVREALVTYQENDVRLGAHLVADVSSRPSQKVLRRYVAEALPAYMRPSVFAWLDELPMNSFGAIDHDALPPFPAEEEPSFVAPSSALEKVMAGIWAELIGVEMVGRDDGFFELGGHSLLGTQLCSRLLDIFDIMIPIQQLFEKPVLADFCSVVLEESSDRARTEKIAELMLTVAEIPDAELTT